MDRLPGQGRPFPGSRQPSVLPRHGVTLALALPVSLTSSPSLALPRWQVAGGERGSRLAPAAWLSLRLPAAGSVLLWAFLPSARQGPGPPGRCPESPKSLPSSPVSLVSLAPRCLLAVGRFPSRAPPLWTRPGWAPWSLLSVAVWLKERQEEHLWKVN